MNTEIEIKGKKYKFDEDFIKKYFTKDFNIFGRKYFKWTYSDYDKYIYIRKSGKIYYWDTDWIRSEIEDIKELETEINYYLYCMDSTIANRNFIDHTKRIAKL